jgi:hypothetical protein
LLAAGPGEPWRAPWNDPGQMAMFENPTFEGDMLIFTIGYPEDLPGADEQRTLKTFEVRLQNVSFP